LGLCFFFANCCKAGIVVISKSQARASFGKNKSETDESS
jgi:hypothetical protein